MSISQLISQQMEKSSWIRRMFEQGMELKQIHGEFPFPSQDGFIQAVCRLIGCFLIAAIRENCWPGMGHVSRRKTGDYRTGNHIRITLQFTDLAVNGPAGFSIGGLLCERPEKRDLPECLENLFP